MIDFSTINLDMVKTLTLTALAGWIGTTFKSIPHTLMNNIVYYTSKTVSTNTDDSTIGFMHAYYALRKMTLNSFYTRHLSEPILCEARYDNECFRPEVMYDNGFINKSEFDELVSLTGDNSIRVLYKPLPCGTHLAYLGRLTWVRFSYDIKVKETVNGDMDSRDKSRKSLSINFLGLHADEYTKKFINHKYEILEIREQLEQDWLNKDVKPHRIHYISKSQTRMTPRPKETVFCKDKDRIIEAIRTFANSEKEYLALGLPYKFNILLYGKPGTGKTSLVKMIATECTRFGGIIDYNYMQNHEHAYGDSFKGKVANIILLEEIDTMCKNRVDDKGKPKEKKSEDLADLFSVDKLKDILETLDGTKTIHGLVTVSTTNHVELLDEAVKRRFDLVIEVENLDRGLAEDMCKLYNADTAILNTLEFPINPSKLSRLLLEIGENNLV